MWTVTSTKEKKKNPHSKRKLSVNTCHWLSSNKTSWTKVVLEGIFLLLTFKCKKQFFKETWSFFNRLVQIHVALILSETVAWGSTSRNSSIYCPAFLFSESDPERHKTAESNLWQHPSNQKGRNHRLEVKELLITFFSLRAAANPRTSKSTISHSPPK